MFVLIESGGEYEGKWEKIVCGSEDKQLLISRGEKLKAEREVMSKFMDKQSSLIDKLYSNGSYPQFDRNKLREIKKRKSGISNKEITPEMRSERDADLAYNAKLNEDHSKLIEEWNENIKKPAILALYEQEGITPPESEYEYPSSYFYDTSVTYDIEEIEVLKKVV